MNPSGSPPAADTRRLSGMARGLRLLAVAGSSRFAGCGDYDALPPNFLGYDVRRPRAPRQVVYVPGHVVALEER